jgi:small-conductance mechanosensitive channel
MMTIRAFFIQFLLPILLIASSANPCQAQNAAKPESYPNEATVHVFNRDIITFRSELLGNPPKLRALRAEQRITEQLNTHDPKVSMLHNSLGIIYQINGVMVFILSSNDVDTLNGDTLASTARDTHIKLVQLIKDSSQGRDSRLLLRDFGMVATTTTVLFALLWLIIRIERFIESKLLLLTDAKKIHVNGIAIIPQERLISYVRASVRLLFWLVALLLAYEWLSISLAQFPYTQPWGEQLNEFLLSLVSTLGTSLLSAIPGLITALLIFLIARFIIKILSGLFRHIESGQANLSFIDAELASPTRKIITVCIWLFALVMAYPYLPGSNSEAFKGVSVLLGLMISLGASNIIGQGASGLILTYSKTFRRGEYVRIADHEGTITELGMFTTRIRTGIGEEITLSNSLVFGSITKNYSRAIAGAGYILDTTLTIGYDTPWRQVEAMLLEAAKRTNDINSEPVPQVLQTSLSDFYPEYRLVCQVRPDIPKPRIMVLSTLHAHIQDVFNEYGVQIMSPHYMLDPKTEKTVSAARIYAAPAKSPEL